MLLTPTGLREIAMCYPLLSTWTIDLLGPWISDEKPAECDIVSIPSLSKLAIGSSHVHPEACACGIGYLAAPNIERLELRCGPSVLNKRHFSTLLHPSNTTRLRELRTAVGNITHENLSFLESLPLITDLQLPKLHREDVSLVRGLLALTNVRTITISIHLPNYPGDPITMDTLCLAILHKPKASPLVQLRPRYWVVELPFVVKDYPGDKLRMLRPYYDDYSWLIESWERLHDFDFSEKLSGFGVPWDEDDDSDDYSDGSYGDKEGWEVPSHYLDSDNEELDRYEYIDNF